MTIRIYTVDVVCCLNCPAYNDSDHWCNYSGIPIPEDHDVLDSVTEFCELEEKL